MRHLGMRGEMLKHLECCPIEPLQVVEKQRQRMLRPGEHGQEAAKYPLKAILIFLRRECGNCQLLSDDRYKFGDQVDHELAVRTYRLEQETPPVGYFLFILAEKLAYERLQGLGQGCVGDVALVLIELAAREKA